MTRSEKLWPCRTIRNGLHVYYKIPGNTEENNEGRDDIEILSLLQGGDPGVGVLTPPDPVVRTLGGKRLRYRYIPPSINGVKLNEVVWTISHRGRYCTDYGEDDPAAQCHIIEAGAPYRQTDFGEDETASVYWEPLADAPPPPQLPGTPQVRWDLWAGENTDDEGVQARLRADYTIPSQQEGGRPLGRHFEQDFSIKTRMLRPPNEGEEPMEGRDVAMLEAMLWQFGLSPQRGGDYRGNSMAGSEGARINSSRNRSGEGNWTHNCQNELIDRRDVYYSGWGADCPVGHVSLEGMVKRFRARNELTVDTIHRDPKTNDRVNNDHLYAGIETSGVVDTTLLGFVSKIWEEYLQAYSASYQVADEDGQMESVDYRELPVAGFDSAHINDWITQMLTVWESGDDTAGIEPTYTDERHSEVLAALGVQADNNEQARSNLFRAWKAQEAPYHWGTNEKGYQPTDFRLPYRRRWGR